MSQLDRAACKIVIVYPPPETLLPRLCACHRHGSAQRAHETSTLCAGDRGRPNQPRQRPIQGTPARYINSRFRLGGVELHAQCRSPPTSRHPLAVEGSKRSCWAPSPPARRLAPAQTV